jgi:uncharacterized protein (TIGR02452 family)
MIWSPNCPVFRTDEGKLLDTYYTVNFITSPAPNAGAVRQNEPEKISKIEPVLRERSSKILGLPLITNVMPWYLERGDAGSSKTIPR